MQLRPIQDNVVLTPFTETIHSGQIIAPKSDQRENQQCCEEWGGPCILISKQCNSRSTAIVTTLRTYKREAKVSYGGCEKQQENLFGLRGRYWEAEQHELAFPFRVYRTIEEKEVLTLVKHDAVVTEAGMSWR